MVWSEKRDSNPRPQPWQGCALPTELFSQIAEARRFGNIYVKELFWSEKRDSNPRPQPWQGCALPTELFSRLGHCCAPVFVVCVAKVRIFFELAIVSAIFLQLFSDFIVFIICAMPAKTRIPATNRLIYSLILS